MQLGGVTKLTGVAICGPLKAANDGQKNQIAASDRIHEAVAQSAAWVQE
jgi:hypothetical protein